MSASPAISKNTREQWLERHKTLITASRVPAILGLVPNRAPSDVYMEMTGQSEVSESEPMKWGKRFEAGIAEGYQEETGRALERWPQYEIAIHPDLPWLGATPDFLTRHDEGNAKCVHPPAEGDGALEVKLTAVHAEDWRDEPPMAFQLQNQIQQACLGLKWGSVAGCISTFKPVAWADFKFDEELFKLLVPRLEEFLGYVRRQEPPTEDVNWWSSAAVKRIYRADNQKTVTLGDDAAYVVKLWNAAKAAEKAAKAEVETYGKALRLRMGDCATGTLPDGTCLVRSIVAAGRVEAYDREPYSTLKHAKKPKKS